MIEADNGKEAEMLIDRERNSLSAVLLDIAMPEINGYELLNWMRADPELALIPVIMVTGTEDESSRVKALLLGANDFITKPFDPDIVRHCLNNCISLREASVLARSSQKDKLTDLYNREAFFEKTREMIDAHEREYYILASFDIDNFKYVNDQYGAAEGDKILCHIAMEMQKTFDDLQ